VAKREINNLNKFIASRMRVVNDITERGLVSLDKYKKLPYCKLFSQFKNKFLK